MPQLGAPELIIILVIVLLIFGGAKLPKLARSLGEAKNEFEKSAKDKDGKLTPKEAAAAREAASAKDEQVTMSKAELDALLAEREAQAKKNG